MVGIDRLLFPNLPVTFIVNQYQYYITVKTNYLMSKKIFTVNNSFLPLIKLLTVNYYLSSIKLFSIDNSYLPLIKMLTVDKTIYGY